MISMALNVLSVVSVAGCGVSLFFMEKNKKEEKPYKKPQISFWVLFVLGVLIITVAKCSS